MNEALAMRTLWIIALMLLPTPHLSAQQQVVEYLIEARVFAANPQEIGSARTVISPTLRVRSGKTGLVDLNGGLDGIRMTVTPSEIGGNKVGLSVEIAVRRSGLTLLSRFDVLNGEQTHGATVALRADDGAFIVDAYGRPMFATFQTTIRR